MSFRSSLRDRDAVFAELATLEPDLPVAVALTDLDGFGPLNDRCGESAGDGVLAALERQLSEKLPPQALIAHMKGDEFLVALPDASCEEALLILEAVRASFSGDRVPGADASLGLSIGIAGRPAHGSTPAELAEAADAALVRAKQAGGNRVAIHVEERMILKSSYYSRPSLHRLAKLARRTGRSEASLLREALEDYLARHAELV